jgi:Domain of unknown function (DUF4383)
MTRPQKICLFYAAALLSAALLNYIPGLTDEHGRAFGIFALDIHDEVLHFVLALFALVAALRSRQAARSFLLIFGIAYFGDGLLGLLTGYGFLDLGVFTNRLLGMDLSLTRIAANLPSMAFGGLAIAAGTRPLRRTGLQSLGRSMGQQRKWSV